MEKAGIYEIVKIQYEWDNYMNESPELYEYIKSFYWTL